MDNQLTTDLIRGAVEVEETADGLLPHRLPPWARAQCPDPQLLMAESQPAGVRLAFRTSATTVELDTVPTKRVYVGAPARPDGTYDLVVDGALAGQGTVTGGRVLTIDLATGSFSTDDGGPGTVRFGDLAPGEKDVEIWLPHDETTELVALRADAPVATLAGSGRTWLHHGSSISQGSNATHPTGTWPAVAARAAGVDLVNLGLGGSALLDPFVARTMRDLPADVVSVKVGINLVNADLMRRRALGPALHGMLDTLRDGHPDTPLLVVTPIHCPMHEEVPGPTVPDTSALAEGRIWFVAAGDVTERASGKLALADVREVVAEVVDQRSASDPALRLVDGPSLYGPADAGHLPLADGLHPGPEIHRLVGDRFAASLRA